MSPSSSKTTSLNQYQRWSLNAAAACKSSVDSWFWLFLKSLIAFTLSTACGLVSRLFQLEVKLQDHIPTQQETQTWAIPRCKSKSITQEQSTQLLDGLDIPPLCSLWSSLSQVSSPFTSGSNTWSLQIQKIHLRTEKVASQVWTSWCSNKFSSGYLSLPLWSLHLDSKSVEPLLYLPQVFLSPLSFLWFGSGRAQSSNGSRWWKTTRSPWTTTTNKSANEIDESNFYF